MSLPFDPNTLTIDQARKIINHLDSRLNVLVAANNILIEKIGKITSTCAPSLANEARAVMNEWSSALNSLDDGSNAEMLRIIGQEPPRPARMN